MSQTRTAHRRREGQMGKRRGGGRAAGGPSLGDLLTSRPSGLVEAEAWAVLCQAVQALQDLFLSDGASCNLCLPLVTPSTLMLSPRGRVRFCKNQTFVGSQPPMHLFAYLAPEYEPNKGCSDTEMEKMWIFSLGETLKRATLTSHVATSCLSVELCRVLADMTRLQAFDRASLMHLLDVISDYCQRRQQNRPFSHIVMDLHQEAMAAVETVMDVPWVPPAMPEIIPRTVIKTDSSSSSSSIPRRWLGLSLPKLTKDSSTSMEELTEKMISDTPGSVMRPKSMCMPIAANWMGDGRREASVKRHSSVSDRYFDVITKQFYGGAKNSANNVATNATTTTTGVPSVTTCHDAGNNTRLKVRRNPVQRITSRASRRDEGASIKCFQPIAAAAITTNSNAKDCIGPEFVVKAALPHKHLIMADCKSNSRKIVTVIMLNGQKLDVACNLGSTKAGQLFELIIQKEHVEENFMLGLAALVAGDFVFLPSDTRISKAFQSNANSNNHNTYGRSSNPTLFVRVRLFMPSLRGIRSVGTRHLLYLQLRRSILEHQLPCSFRQIIELNGLALQAEFGDFEEQEHGTRNYFLLEHYIPETMAAVIEDPERLRRELVKAHISKTGLDPGKAEEDFIAFSQSLPHYGGHFYTATWICKDNKNKEVWLYISAQGINLYERGQATSHFGPQLYETFEWRSIQTLCYSKYYLCILPHGNLRHKKPKKYKLKMDHKKSYFAFRLASLHHQFFLRLRTEYTSLQILSQQFGVPLKDMKNETNSLYKLNALAERKESNIYDEPDETSKRRTLVNLDLDAVNEDLQNRANLGLSLSSSALPAEKRRGVKMGTRAFVRIADTNASRSLEAVDGNGELELEEDDGDSIGTVSLRCSSESVSKSQTSQERAYVLDSTIRPTSHLFLPDFQETLSESLMEKLNNFSFVEERMLCNVSIRRDQKGSLGLQITEGSDGNVYVQSVVPRGPASLSGSIQRGDQVVAVDGVSLLGLRYESALDLLKRSMGDRVDFVLARLSTTGKKSSTVSVSPINEKHVTEDCKDSSNVQKYAYHKHIRYEVEPKLNRTMSKSCGHLDRDKAVIVGMIPKDNVDLSQFYSLDRRYTRRREEQPQVPVPRSLGLSRKWRGPVRYPVTPVKESLGNDAHETDSLTYTSTSDEEQIFI